MDFDRFHAVDDFNPDLTTFQGVDLFEEFDNQVEQTFTALKPTTFKMEAFDQPTPHSEHETYSSFGLDSGLPTNHEDFTAMVFNQALSNYKTNSGPSSALSSLNSTPVSNNETTPSSGSFTSFDPEESSSLFPGLMATNPETVGVTPMNSSFNFSPAEFESFTHTAAQPARLSSPYQSSNYESPDIFAPQQLTATHLKAKSVSSGSTTRSGSVSSGSGKSRNSLDSRLSLQRLGEILNTKSQEETMRLEKFVLNIFEHELGFPLGHQTWIRDTSEEYRRTILDKLHARVSPTYPQMTKSLLETIIRRATYSMMQGRLRKERRAASKKRGAAKGVRH